MDKWAVGVMKHFYSCSSILTQPKLNSISARFLFCSSAVWIILLHANGIALLQGITRLNALFYFNASLPVVLAAIIIMCCVVVCAVTKKCNPTMVRLA
jgi:lysylphosphatidylglycerol synthetase-like protein (DUF2156 family)